MASFLWPVVLLLPVIQPSEPLPARWLPGDYTNTTADAQRFVRDYNSTAEEVIYRNSIANWMYSTNLTDYNSKVKNNASLVSQAFTEAWGTKAKQVFPPKVLERFHDPELKRLFKRISRRGIANLPKQERKEYNKILSSMERIFSIAKVCPKPSGCWNIEPELTGIMASSRNYNKLLYAWEGWHNASGIPIRKLFPRYVELSNKAYQGDGFKDTGEHWRSDYEAPTFESDLEEIYTAIEPLYQHLHAYVRRKLYSHYGPKYINLKGPIPTHLLGNMWSQTWSNIYEMMIPFPSKPSVTVTEEMVKQGYNVSHMFHMADDFFISLGLIRMRPEFWANSMMEKPADREVVCHASAWDFNNRKDFRIKMCAEVNMEDFITIHHEMGHIEYFMQYKDQPTTFRNGANPGFHEAIGDVMALSACTQKHLHAIGLMDSVTSDAETDINYLFNKALEKIAFLPFGYLIDQWRWGVFSGHTPEEHYNSEWWRLRTKYQGVCPPTERTEEHFDPGAKYHVAASVPYIRYFFSYIVQFQIHESLCKAAKHTGPLHTCDIYNSKEAGALLATMLRSGSSKPWQQVLKEALNTDKLDPGALMRYFKPLIEWLEKQNVNETLGWPQSSWVPPVPEDYHQAIQRGFD